MKKLNLTKEEHNEKKKIYSRQWRLKNKDKKRDCHIKYTFGISSEQWDLMFKSQGSRCAICRSVSTGSKNFWHTDHCHISNVVRGILCHHCNLLLGHAKDNISVLKEAIKYLNAWVPEIARRKD